MTYERLLVSIDRDSDDIPIITVFSQQQLNVLHCVNIIKGNEVNEIYNKLVGPKEEHYENIIISSK